MEFINEKALDFYGETIINTDETLPYVEEDYLDELKEQHDAYYDKNKADLLIEEQRRLAEERNEQLADELKKIEENQRQLETERKKEAERRAKLEEELRKVGDVRKLEEERLIAEEKVKQEAEQQKIRYRQQNVCQYCGGVFTGLFNKKCKVCGKPKDYM